MTAYFSKILLRCGLAAVMLLAGAGVATAGTSGKNTAAFYKANIDKYEGKRVTIDVAFVRAVAMRQEPEDYRLFWAATVDEDERAPGGGIIIVADRADAEKLLRKYGTNVERDGPRRGEVELDSMRGTLRKIDLERMRKVPYLDLTDGGVNLSEEARKAMEAAIASEEGPVRRGFRGRMGPPPPAADEEVINY